MKKLEWSFAYAFSGGPLCPGSNAGKPGFYSIEEHKKEAARINHLDFQANTNWEYEQGLISGQGIRKENEEVNIIR